MLHVPNDRETIEISAYWPIPLINLDEIHKKWLKSASPKISMVYIIILACENALRRKRTRAADRVMSTAGIPLPAVVLTHIEKKPNLFIWMELV